MDFFCSMHLDHIVKKQPSSMSFGLKLGKHITVFNINLSEPILEASHDLGVFHRPELIKKDLILKIYSFHLKIAKIGRYMHSINI